MVTIESQPEILTVDPVYEDSEYITGTVTKGYTDAIIAYDSNNNIVAVAGRNESTNGTFKLAIQRKPVPGEKLTIKNFDSEGVTIIKGKQITVQERNVAPTLQSEKEIHVPYGTEWSDEIAKEQAKVKATDGKGNDVTKDVVVTSNPVDTTKLGSYTVEFSITEDGLTSTSQTTVVVDEAIAPTIESEKEIHVAYGSEWNDELAKEQAKVKATDGQGNDVTKDVVVTSNPVDTTKPGSYTVEFSITKDGLTSTSQTIVIVDEQEKDY
ncbi:immunoglobulin-like domain-containing protein, partial [Enterococcus villorum]|uniref:immunoglobulin-like domain-containing protein n=1 Tax=Enterococcus villorum TaxID=112904 RepID=UPI0011789963